METIIPSADAVYINAEAAEKLLSSGSGDAALLYISILKNHGAFDRSEAEKLPLSGGVDAALDKLRELGLVKGRPSREREQPPRVSVDEIYGSAKSGSGFAELVPELESILGKPLSPAELQTFFCAFDYLRLPPEVIMMLLNYCVASSKGRLPSMRFIEKEAYVWANREILTLEQADAYIAGRRALQEQSVQTAELLGIRGRELSPTESRYIRAWLEMGFDSEMIALAYDRTVTQTGGLKWRYLNGILENWREKGLFTPQAVREKDGRRRTEAKKADKPDDLDRLIRDLEKI